jgi:hypothetical protein
MNKKVKDFFTLYEKAIAESAVEQISELYADVFMFGTTESFRSVNKADFLRVLPKRSEAFAAMGLRSSTIDSLEASELDSRYVLVKAVWKMRFEGRDKNGIESKNSATYILFAARNSFEIIVQLDHQDLTKKAQQLALK